MKIYFMGIGGTGMASVAGLAKEAGHEVAGSDMNMYPPMSTMLDDLGIKVFTPYAQENLDAFKPDMIVVANALSKTHIEVGYALEKNIALKSSPQFMGEEFLQKSLSLVIAGTHGKTTTSSLTAFLLHELGEDPSFMIGGIPKNFKYSFHLKKPVHEKNIFVIEGDEYDTAFFDKGPKFLHYAPKFLVMNNLEFDHADIYANVEKIAEQFTKLAHLVPENKSAIVANIDDEYIADILNKNKFNAKIYTVATLGKTQDAFCKVTRCEPLPNCPRDAQKWRVDLDIKNHGKLELHSLLSGSHNAANIAQAVTVILALSEQNCLQHKFDFEKLKTALLKFKNVARRLDFLGSKNNIDIYEDFAHHPTAVATVIDNYRKSFPERRVVVAFEPKNASSRRNIFHHEYVKSFQKADLVFIGAVPEDKKLTDETKMDTYKLARDIGKGASAYKTNDELLENLKKSLKPNDTVIFMSPGSFSGIQHRLLKEI